MFGEWGGLILQLSVTAVVIVGLIAVVYWLVIRYSAGGLGRLNRGRVPRLAVIDAMAIDGRRRLVLVRRDNVEHLILLGGPTDVVVEPAIQRPRQRAVARPQAIGSAPESPPSRTDPLASPPESQPIPFPQSRIGQPATHQPAPATERNFAPIRRAAPLAPTLTEPLGNASPILPFEPSSEPPVHVHEPQPFEASAHQQRTIYAPHTAANGSAHQAYKEFSNGASQPTAANPFATHTPADSETVSKVNDLEREMARLLGEITANRSS